MSIKENESKSNTGEKGVSWLRLMGILLIIVAIIVAIYLAVGYFAWQSGQALRAENEAQQFQAQLGRQVELAGDDIVGGSFNLALRRLEWVLERDPQNEDALSLQRQGQAALKTALTPDAPLTPTPLPEPTAVAGVALDPAQTLAHLQRLADREQWENLLAETLAFQRQHPNYERVVSDNLLFEAYLNTGLLYVQGDRLEEGISYLASAEKLRNLSQEALDYWLWAELYLNGLAYYGVNWAVASSNFRDLCLAAPFYQGACDRLFESLVAYGDQYVFAQEWCPAQDLYREARQYGNNQTLGEKLSAAVEGCAEATPTPTEPITGTVPIDGAEPSSGSATGE